MADDRPEIENGEPHVYDAVSREQHLTHRHYRVYDEGGLLGPAMTLAVNASGEPELVYAGDDRG